MNNYSFVEPTHRHKRPLDSPNSREEVVRAAVARGDYIVIDSDDDFESGFREKRRRVADDTPLGTFGTVIGQRNVASSILDSENQISESSMKLSEVLLQDSHEQLLYPSDSSKHGLSDEQLPKSGAASFLHLPSPQVSDILSTDGGDISAQHFAAQTNLSSTEDQNEPDMETSIRMAQLIAEPTEDRSEHTGDRVQHADKHETNDLALERNKVAWEQQGQAAIRHLRSRNVVTSKDNFDGSVKFSIQPGSQHLAPVKTSLAQLAERYQSADSDVEQDHAVNNDPAVYETLLDIAQQHGRAQKMQNRSKGQSHQPRKRTRMNANDLHQTLRAVTGGYKAPIRHINPRESLRQESVIGNATSCDSNQAPPVGVEGRLRELTGRHQQESAQNFPFMPILSPSPSNDKTSSSPLCYESKEGKDATQCGTQHVSPSPSQSRKGDSDQVAKRGAQGPNNECSTHAQSVLERLVAAQKQREPEPMRLKSGSPRTQAPSICSKPSGIVVGYPSQGENLSLPKMFHRFDDETRSIITKHETLKERKRDLDAIKSAFDEIARLGCVAPFEKSQEQEVNTVHEFARKVIHEKLSGSKKRLRITHIIKNIKRRVNRNNLEPDPTQFEALRQNVMAQGDAEKVETERAALDSEIEKVGALRFARTKMRQSSGNSARHSAFKSCKTSTQRVRFGQATLIPEPKDVREQISKSERSIKAYKDSLNREETLLRSKLALFNQNIPNGNETDQINSEGGLLRDEEDVGNDANDLQSEFSVEDEGQEFMRPLGFPQIGEQEPVIHNRQSDDLNKEDEEIQEGISPVASAQQADQDLIVRMKQSEHNRNLGAQMQSQTLLQEQSRRPELAKQRLDHGDENLESEDTNIEVQEFDDQSDQDDDEDYVDDEERMVYRYVVKAIFKGVPDCDDNNEYCFGKYLSLKKASKRMSALYKDVLEQYKQSHKEISDLFCRETVTKRHGLEERKFELGPDSQVCGRIWSEKEFYTVSHEMYQKAKFHRACTARPIHVVEWMKTIREVLDEEQAMEKTPEGETHANAESTVLNHSTDRQESLDTVNELVGKANAENQKDEDRLLAIEQGENSSADNEESLIDSENAANIEDNLDDLFGKEDTPLTSPDSDTEPIHSSPNPPSSPFPSTQEGTIITRSASKDFQPYTSIALANRRAKDLFCTWWHGHLRGEKNFKYIREEEMYMEKALEACGDHLCWKREEDFDFIEQGKDENGRKMNEKFSVWVRTINVKGPGN